MADIFVSYAREDRSHADGIADGLRTEGFSVWSDVTIRTGKTFDQVIQEELDAARCVVVLWSKVSVASEWVREEADEGKRRGILIPIQVEEGVQIPLGFRRIQTASFAHWTGAPSDRCFRDLVRDISALLGTPLSTARVEGDRVVESEPRFHDQAPNQSSGLPLPARQRARMRFAAIAIGLLCVLGLIGGLVYVATRISLRESGLTTKAEVDRERIALMHQKAHDLIGRGSDRVATACTQLQIRAGKQTTGLSAARSLQDKDVEDRLRSQIEEHTKNIANALKGYGAYLDQLTQIDPPIVTEEFDRYGESLGTSNARGAQIARVMKRDYEARRRGAGPVDEKAMQDDCAAVGSRGA